MKITPKSVRHGENKNQKRPEKKPKYKPLKRRGKKKSGSFGCIRKATQDRK
jgi:hypothetical protein